jgi:hypothetical protein
LVDASAYPRSIHAKHSSGYRVLTLKRVPGLDTSGYRGLTAQAGTGLDTGKRATGLKTLGKMRSTVHEAQRPRTCEYVRDSDGRRPTRHPPSGDRREVVGVPIADWDRTSVGSLPQDLDSPFDGGNPCCVVIAPIRQPCCNIRDPQRCPRRAHSCAYRPSSPGTEHSQTRTRHRLPLPASTPCHPERRQSPPSAR